MTEGFAASLDRARAAYAFGVTVGRGDVPAMKQMDRDAFARLGEAERVTYRLGLYHGKRAGIAGIVLLKQSLDTGTEGV